MSFSYVKKKHATELSNRAVISGNLEIKMLTTRSSGKLQNKRAPTATPPIDATCVCGKIFHHLPPLFGHFEQAKRASIILQTR